MNKEAKRHAWDVVEDMLKNAKAMHYDGCHKIYLSMDDAGEGGKRGDRL